MVDAAARTSTVTIETGDGWTLSGQSTSYDDGPVVLLLHDVGSDHQVFGPLLGLLHERRPFNTLAIDVRGHGFSVHGPGGATPWQEIDRDASGWTDVAIDLESSLAWLRRASPMRRVYVVAWTYGADAAFARADEDPRIAGVVALSPSAGYRGVSLRERLPPYVASGRHLFVLTAQPSVYAQVMLGAMDARDAGAPVISASEMNAPVFVLSIGPIGARGEALLASRPDLWSLVEDWLRLQRDGTAPRTQAPSPRAPPVPGEPSRMVPLFRP